MTDSVFYGLALVLGAGACQGSFMLPTKWIKGWVWENYWLIFSSTAYLICPWILALATIPGLFDVYARVSMGSLVSVAIYGTGWGFGALTFGLGRRGARPGAGICRYPGCGSHGRHFGPAAGSAAARILARSRRDDGRLARRDDRRCGHLLPLRSMEGDGERRGEIVQARPCDRDCFRTSLILRKPGFCLRIRNHTAGRTTRSVGDRRPERTLDAARISRCFSATPLTLSGSCARTARHQTFPEVELGATGFWEP